MRVGLGPESGIVVAGGIYMEQTTYLILDSCLTHLHHPHHSLLLHPLLAQTSKHLFVSYYCSVVFRQEHHIKLIANNYSHGKKKSRGLINFFSGKQTMYSTNMKLNYQYSLYYTNMKLNYLPFYILNNKTCTYHIRLNYMVVK